MKVLLTIPLLFLNFFADAQNIDVKNWLNQNSINLEKLNVNQEFKIDEKLLSTEFRNAKIFGFGEATHHNKEFFDLKSMFFKYLVLNQGVRIFVLEESFGATHDINEYINGKEGNLRNLIKDFRQHIWKTEEMFTHIEWMKNYNSSQPSNNRICFYGNDCMFNYRLATIIKEKLQECKIATDEQQNEVLEYFSKEIYSLKDYSNFDNSTISQARKLVSDIKSNSNSNSDLILVVESFSNYLDFLVNPTQTTRDKCMARLIEKIYEKSDEKIFIWAHNEHIKKTSLFKENVPSMGNHLSKKYSSNYYSMGFEFGIGTLLGYNQKEKKWENNVLNEPVKNTNSDFLFTSESEVFYFDFNIAKLNLSMKNFIEQKRNYVVIGGYGFNPKYLKFQIASEKYSEMFDGLIYVKKLSRSTPLK